MEKGSIRHGNVETLPRFIRHLRDLRCCDGDAITLECHVEALPEPIIIWEKDGRILHSGKDFAMSYDGIKATLSIPRVYPEDEGEYTCLAKNTIGRTLSSACIIVDVPEEKENMLNRQLSRPTGLLSANSTPRSTPRNTPNRSFSPLRLSYRNTSIDLSCGSERRRGGMQRQAIAAPKFLAIPHNRVVEEGDSVRFQCTIAGHPTPWSTWDKDGLIVTPTTRISVKEIDDLRFLEIEEVTFDDAGLYRITLENDYGRIEATARLDVIGSTRYSKSPSVRGIRSSSSRRTGYIHRRIMGPSTAIGGRMALAGGFRGSSMPLCKFYHNGMELQDSQRVSIIVAEQEVFLFVDDVTEQDQGIYTCVIQGDDHEPLVSSTLVQFHATVADVAKNKQHPRIVRALPEQTESIEMETIDLCFELDCAEPYDYVWTRNGEIIRDSEEFNYIDHGNGLLCLRIHDAFDLDSGVYACEVSTAEGLTCSTAGQLTILETVNRHEDGDNLVLLKSPLPAIATFGSDEAMFCARVHPSDAEATWFVCGRKVVDAGGDSTEFTLESSVDAAGAASADGLRILRIHNVNHKHSGEIQLCVTHPGKLTPSIRSYTSLVVLQELTSEATTTPPTTHKQITACILEGPEDCTALIGGSVKLSVAYEAHPRPQVKWYKAYHPITQCGNITIRTNAHRSTLLISDIAADDSGKYTVEVMNEFGADIAVASVAVEGPPDPPSGKPSISQGADRIAVAWCGPPYDGGCMLTGFIIEMQQLPSSADNILACESDGEGTEWKEVATVVDSLAYTIKNLLPQSVYRFRVRAENVHGRSEPGSPSDCVEIMAREGTTEDFHRPVCVKSGGDFKSRFDIIEELGKGRFGVVYKVQEKELPRQLLAAKVIKCIKSRDRQKVQDEISIMRSLQHPKLLQLAASFESPREIVMVMEFITGGELFERVVADDFTLTELDCILFLRQVCEGVAYMHSQSIVHLDLKPENIMCHTRTSHQIKIIDFGLAQRLNTNSPVRVLFGTPEFIPPEIISYEPIGFQSDMWSVGVICYVLLSGLSPFMGDSDVETFANITRADYDFDDEAFDCVSEEAKDFISNLLVHRKENRWSAKQCLESKWLTQGHDENLSNNKICTDKLKKFIIRRKWQKTGNAIRALGRMATLSASRRNSAAGSLPNSPRPSISGVFMLNPSASLKMYSLLEEKNDDDDNDVFSIELPHHDASKKIQKSLKIRDKSQCSERSDSGYSECSNCSAGGNVPCHCPQHPPAPLLAVRSYEKEDVADVTDAPAETLLSIAIPHDVLKSKLEAIAKEADNNNEETKIELVVNELPLPYDDNHNELKALEHSELNIEILEESTEYETLASPTPAREPIMRSDFTNTIEMRKQSLENNVTRDKLKPSKPPFESSGKVSMLKNKFSHANNETSERVSSVASKTYKSKDCMDVAYGQQTVFNRFACNNQTNAPTKSQQSTSMPSSPLPARSNTPVRLSGRVKVATERLAQQQTVSSAKRNEARRSPSSGATKP